MNATYFVENQTHLATFVVTGMACQLAKSNASIEVDIWRCLINYGLHRGDVTKLSAPIQHLAKICASHCFAKRVKSLGFKWLKQSLRQQLCYHRGDPGF